MSIGATPYYLVYGMEAVVPLEVKIPFLRVLMESGLEETKWAKIRYEQLNMISERRHPIGPSGWVLSASKIWGYHHIIADPVLGILWILKMQPWVLHCGWTDGSRSEPLAMPVVDTMNSISLGEGRRGSFLQRTTKWRILDGAYSIKSAWLDWVDVWTVHYSYGWIARALSLLLTHEAHPHGVSFPPCVEYCHFVVIHLRSYLRIGLCLLMYGLCFDWNRFGWRSSQLLAPAGVSALYRLYGMPQQRLCRESVPFALYYFLYCKLVLLWSVQGSLFPLPGFTYSCSAGFQPVPQACLAKHF
ncbi:hypothetical protein NC651_028546 [Populus alba x Populus x berolinensis]|nr:hypothetical protein NC651_028546 [Populus alba x Populus x berolinensis]